VRVDSERIDEDLKQAEEKLTDDEEQESEDEDVPNGEEDIDELGRNPTQRRIDERGGERFG
jgi:hypothetical protein